MIAQPIVARARPWQWIYCALLILTSSMVSAAEPANASGAATTGQGIVHMLDYVGIDYSGAVENGKIKNADEYKEMTEFAAQIREQIKTLPEHPRKREIAAAAEKFARQIADKVNNDAVSDAAAKLRWDIINTYKLTVTPRRVPDFVHAAQVYARDCAACHGAQGRGDGPAAKGLEPPPANFHDAERMAGRSVYGLYNTITLGVGGTSMGAFKQLTEDERWALAFLTSNFGTPTAQRERGQKLWQAGEARSVFPDMGNVVALSANEVRTRYGDNTVRVQDYLRAEPPALATNKPAPIAYARDKLALALASYRSGDRAAAQQLAISAYLEGFELTEATLDTLNAKLRLEIENRMIALRATMRDAAPMEEVEQQMKQIDDLLVQADEEMKSTQMSAPATALSAFLILLREGLEALLVVATIIAFLARAGRRDAMRYIHLGWISAIILGIATWFVASYLIEISGANREITEGAAALFSAAILIYVGFWLHSKSYANRWREFIETHLKGALSRGTLWALASVSFVAVYREMFETVLFYEALWAQAGPEGTPAIMSGLVGAVVLLAVTGWLLFRYGMRLPIGPFFAVSSILLAVLAVVFVGQGVAALQEAGMISVHMLELPTVRILGIHPTSQSLLAQLATLAIVVLGFIYSYRTSQQRRA